MIKQTKIFSRWGMVIVIGLVFLMTASMCWGQAHEVNDLTIKRLGQTTQIILQGNGPFNYKDFTLDNPPRVVIDCMNSEHNLPGPRTYVLERGGVVAVRSSALVDPIPKVRLIIDLETMLPYVVFKEGKNLIVALDAVTAMPFAEWQASKFYQYQRPPRTEAFFYTKGREAVVEPITYPAEDIETSPAVEPKASIDDDDYDDSELIDVEYENGDLISIIRSFAAWSNQNIVIDPGVSGKVSVSLRQVPVRKALDIILKINGFAIVEEEPGNIWRVTSISKIKEAQMMEEARADSLESVVPLKTEVVGIEYANASQLASSIVPSERGNIQVNDRTNSLIVTDTPSNIERIKEMIKKLDTPTTQVNIEARIVEIGNDVSRELGIKWGSTVTDSAGALMLVDLSNKLTDSATDAIGTDTDVKLNVVLNALEEENKAHTISNPNITVLNHEKANINSGDNLPFFQRDESGNLTIQFVQTGIILDVTPHVNPNERITMDVIAEVSTARAAGTGISAAFAVNRKRAQTKVMVDNGATAVIGGLMSSDESVVEAKVPILSKLPIIGGLLFTNESKIKRDRELLVFLTPKIISAPPDELY